jgi:FlaA1/EpsC-like NDP-sugar epimerase
MLTDKVVVVTGGTGSMGKVLVKRILTGEKGMPRKLIVMSRDESKQHDMRLSFLHKKVSTDEVVYRNFMNVLEFRIGDVRDYADVCTAIKNADIVINAAALKQVPTCEYFPEQAVLTNCLGAMNIVRAINEHNYAVQTVIGISTDKACKPINVMGMSKALQERIFIAANITSPKTRFICVRYGNVLASRGSVVPVFLDQIKNGGPLTITDPNMTRFLLSINQAIDTVFAALRDAQPGDIFVPNAPSATIENLAKALIAGRDVPIQYVGTRPGERRYTIKYANYFAVTSMLPELQQKKSRDAITLNKEFSSQDTVLDYAGTVELLRQHGLLNLDIMKSLAINEELLV